MTTRDPWVLFRKTRTVNMLTYGWNNMRVTESEFICSHLSIRPKRFHRRRRVQKKWLKRYGTTGAGCKGAAYEIAGQGIVVCPHYMKHLRKHLKETQ